MPSQVNQQFEQAFATLAYAFLQDKAQKLLEYLVGFQLIKKNDDDTRAAGAFGFKCDDNWLYAPVFFLSGDLKGHEMIYAKTPDLMLPMEESWVNFLLSRGYRSLGEGNSDAPARSGAVSPDFRPYYRSPLQQSTKASAADLGTPDAQDWLVCTVVKNAGFRSEAFDLRPLLEMMVVDPTAGVYRENAERFDLKNMVKEAGFLDVLADACLRRPAFKSAVSKFYSGADLLPPLVDKKAEAVTREDLQRSGLSREVFNYYLRDLAARGVVSDESDVSRRVRTLLRQKGVDDPRLIRANMSVLLEAPEPLKAISEPPAASTPPDGEAKLLDASTTEPLAEKEAEAIMRDGFDIRDTRKMASEVIAPPQVMNPREGGMYEVLDSSGAWVDALVIPAPSVIGLGSASAASQVVSKKRTALVPSGAVFASGRKEGKLPEGTIDFDSAKVDARYVAVSPDGMHGTVAFMVRAKVDGMLHVAPSTCLQSYTGPSEVSVMIADDWRDGDAGRYKVLARGAVASAKAMRSMLVVPRDWKLLEVDTCPSFYPGDLSMAASAMLEKASAYPVGVTHSGHGFAVQHKQASPTYARGAKQAVWLLVSEHGLRKDAAVACVRDAERSGFSALVVKTAAAAPGYMSNVHELDQPASYMDETGVPVAEPASQNVPVDGMREDYADDETYRWRPVADRQATSAAEQAAASGDKDIFDLAALSSLVNAVEIDSRSAKFLRDITRGLDRVGRLLFMYYWHYDKYSERYGDDEMQELEEALRNTFTAMGATVLFLKKRTIEPDRAIQGSDANLDDVADTE